MVVGGLNEGNSEGAVRRKELIKVWATEGKERKTKESQGEIHKSKAIELKVDQ